MAKDDVGDAPVFYEDISFPLAAYLTKVQKKAPHRQMFSPGADILRIRDNRISTVLVRSVTFSAMPR
jgi:hypothetical protein